jgi:hypothetical protein
MDFIRKRRLRGGLNQNDLTKPLTTYGERRSQSSAYMLLSINLLQRREIPSPKETALWGRPMH